MEKHQTQHPSPTHAVRQLFIITRIFQVWRKWKLFLSKGNTHSQWSHNTHRKGSTEKEQSGAWLPAKIFPGNSKSHAPCVNYLNFNFSTLLSQTWAGKQSADTAPDSVDCIERIIGSGSCNTYAQWWNFHVRTKRKSKYAQQSPQVPLQMVSRKEWAWEREKAEPIFFSLCSCSIG